jgi:predicted DNA-binding ribbon-helix-helix protein
MGCSRQNSNKPALSPISLIKQLRDGKISGANLTQESRIACVEYLTSEGYSAAQIAEILNVSLRTIYRDRESVR